MQPKKMAGEQIQKNVKVLRIVGHIDRIERDYGEYFKIILIFNLILNRFCKQDRRYIELFTK